MKKTIRFVGGALLIIVVIAVTKFWWDNFRVNVPQYPPPSNTIWLEQNWTAEQRDWFNHADQGTQTFIIPYEWFMALEQPHLSLSTAGLLSDPRYLDRFGFIAVSTGARNPELPVGFARGGQPLDPSGAPWVNPQTNSPMTALGLTCAACHTGRFTYRNTAVLIDGAPALTRVDKFQQAIGLAIFYTKYLPFRFDRFADRVLGPGASDAAKSELKKQFDEVVSQYDTVRKLQQKTNSQTTQEGFARLDALNRIGNTVFALDANHPENFVGYSAPVHFPRIWNSSWFLWVQYNGSIEQPMTRNAGEALGVHAAVNLTGPKDELFSSSVQVKTLFEIEQLLAGKPPDAQSGFNGLHSPKWPANILPPINESLAAKGAALYKEICEGCHMAPVTDPAFWTSDRWTPPNSAGERYLDLLQIDIQHVGTDPAQAQDMHDRRVTVPSNFGITTDQFGPALGEVVEMTLNRWYDSQQPPVSQDVRDQMNGHRPSGVRALLSYKVRPLNGIWATPPYLHNGSVPNLYALLSPVAERPAKFYLGNREYDPVNVGYLTDEFSGGFEFDTSKRGNSNSGHEFNDAPNKPGVIGRLLSPDERRALIEYLKTL